MKVKMNIVDAFTDVPFKGNPAAVIITDEWLPDDKMQLIAVENNLSETAFAVKCDNDKYELRWFSPKTEIDFCGHATLATAFVLFNQDRALKQLVFSTLAVGDLTVRKKVDGYIEMGFPSMKPEKVAQIPEELLAGLSIVPSEVLRNQQAYFAIYETEEDINHLISDSMSLKKLAPFDVVVTAPSQDYDFVSRYFWPANGGDEDPVTGSIHAGLAPLWSERLNKNEMTVFQASKRGGVLVCRVEPGNIFVSGKAVEYLEGSISI